MKQRRKPGRRNSNPGGSSRAPETSPRSQPQKEGSSPAPPGTNSRRSTLQVLEERQLHTEPLSNGSLWGRWLCWAWEQGQTWLSAALHPPVPAAPRGVLSLAFAPSFLYPGPGGEGAGMHIIARLMAVGLCADPYFNPSYLGELSAFLAPSFSRSEAVSPLNKPMPASPSTGTGAKVYLHAPGELYPPLREYPTFQHCHQDPSFKVLTQPSDLP